MRELTALFFAPVQRASSCDNCPRYISLTCADDSMITLIVADWLGVLTK